MTRSIYIKVGFIITFTAAALIWGLNFLKGKGVFSQQNYFYVVYDRIDGLEVSNAVVVNGFKVGSVTDIYFLEDNSGRLLVEFAVGSEFNIPQKSVAQIFSSDLMGTKAINLLYGESNEFQISGDTLLPDFEGSLTEMVSIQMLPLKNKAEDLMKEMEDAIGVVTYIFNEETRQNVMKSLEDMQGTFHNLESSTSNLDTIVQGGKSKIEALLANVESITNNIEKHNNEIGSILHNVSNITDSIAQTNVKGTFSSLNEAMADLNQIVDKINAGTGSVGSLINNDSLYNNLADASYNLNRLLEDLRINPKRYVHFSAFDFGKTVYTSDPDEAKKKNTKLLYKIQLVRSNKVILLEPENFKGYKNVEENSVNGIYLYTYGVSRKLDKIKELYEEVQADFPEAKILKISEGKYTEIE